MTERSALRQLVAAPFALDEQGDYAAAIEAYTAGFKELTRITTEQSSSLSKADKKQYEQQAKIMRSRKDYLTTMTQIGQLRNVVKIPTRASVNRELEDQTSLSSIHKASSQVTNLKIFDWGNATSNQASALSAQLPANSPPVEYRCVPESETVDFGKKQTWLFIRDPVSYQTFWSFSTIYSSDAPIVGGTLRRCGETMPGAGAINVSIEKTRGGALGLTMQSFATGWTYEVPDRGERRADPLPRRFVYGDRHFVWKSGDQKWESLYETSRVHSVKGSRTGKKTDEIIGEKLFWGKSPTRSESEHSLWFKAGLDQGLVEHCLASQLARVSRKSYGVSLDDAENAAGAAPNLALGIMSLFCLC